MSRDKNKYGTFVTKRPWYFRYLPAGRKRAITLLGSVAVLLLALGGGLALFQTSRNHEAVLDIPEAQAFEIPGWWYQDHFGFSVCPEEDEDCKFQADPDDDKLTNAQEFFYKTDPWNWDSNGNGLTDGEDVAHNFDPTKPGQVSFEEAISDYSVLGESVVFDHEVKDMFAESMDINRVSLPLIGDEELRIIDNRDQTVYESYVNDLEAAIERYFPSGDIQSITKALQSADDAGLDETKTRALLLSSSLKTIPVPRQFLIFHKYSIAFFELLPDVLAPQHLQNSDTWYDKTQAFMVLSQKLNLERELLERELNGL